MREKKESCEGRVLRSGEVISTKWITVLLRKGSEREVGNSQHSKWCGNAQHCWEKHDVNVKERSGVALAEGGKVVIGSELRSP